MKHQPALPFPQLALPLCIFLATAVHAEDAPVPAGADAAGARQLETVTVSAQSENEAEGAYTVKATSTATGLGLSVRETPQAVTVMTRSRMDDQAITDISKVIEQSVGVSLNATSALGSDGVNFYSRGFELKNFQVDGTPRPTSIYGFSETTSDMALYERVEIVRGANGLRSGAGSPAGVVNMIRKRPTTESQASVSARVGSWNYNRLEVDAGGKLTPSGNVRGRFVAVHQDSDAFVERANLEKQLVYGIAEIDVADKTLLTIGAELQDFTNKGASRGGVPLFFLDGSKTDFSRSTNTGAEWNRLSRQTTRLFASLERMFDNGWSVKLDSERSMPDYDESFAYMWGAFDAATGAGSSVGTARWGRDLEQNFISLTASGPFQLLGRQHELMVGTSYSTAEDKGADYPGWWSGGSYWASLPNAWAFLESGRYTRLNLAATGDRAGGRIEQRGSYAAVRLKPADAVSVILGTRVSDWHETRWNRTSAGVTTGETVTDENNVLTPYAGVVVDLGKQLSAYASYADIFEPQSNEDAAGRRLDPLVGKNYELGLKGAFNDGRLNASASLFRIEQDNLAVAIPGAPLNPNGNTPYRAESGTVSKGLELEVAGEVASGWQLGGGYAYAKPEDANGDRLLSEVPKDTVKVFSTYRLSGDLQALTVGGNVRWQGKAFVTGVGPNGEDYAQGSLTLVDLMAKYAVSKNLTATLNVDNLFDKTYYSGLAWSHALYGSPRMVMVGAQYRF